MEWKHNSSINFIYDNYVQYFMMEMNFVFEMKLISTQQKYEYQSTVYTNLPRLVCLYDYLKEVPFNEIKIK